MKKAIARNIDTNHIPIENLAKVSETIPYEILCGISPRVKRIFLED